MADEKNSVIVELHDLAITERKDDRVGRVVKTSSLNVGDLAKIAVARRTDLNITTLESSFELLVSVAVDQVAIGAAVDFGLAHVSLGVEGVFIGDNDSWDSTKHSLKVVTSPTSRMRTKVAKVSANVRGMASSGLFVNSVTDVTTGEVNMTLTPGGAVNVTGSKMKVVGDDPTCGIMFTNETTAEVINIPASSIAINNPSKITFVVPATLAPGDYKMSITTQFSTSASLLKEPRTYVFDYVLSV